MSTKKTVPENVVDSTKSIEAKEQITAAAIVLLQTITAVIDRPSTGIGGVIGVTRIDVPALNLRNPAAWIHGVLRLFSLADDVLDAGEVRAITDLVRAHNAHRHAVEVFRRENRGIDHKPETIERVAFDLQAVEAGLIAFCKVARSDDTAAASAVYRAKAESGRVG